MYRDGHPRAARKGGCLAPGHTARTLSALELSAPASTAAPPLPSAGLMASLGLP